VDVPVTVDDLKAIDDDDGVPTASGDGAATVNGPASTTDDDDGVPTATDAYACPATDAATDYDPSSAIDSAGRSRRSYGRGCGCDVIYDHLVDD
jgi:hypothetical protein